MRYTTLALVFIIAACAASQGEESMLPESRNRTYNGATPVNPQDMNDLQDMCIGSKHGERWHWFNAVEGALASGGGTPIRNVLGNVQFTANQTLALSMPFLYVGQRVKGIGFRGKGAVASSTITATFEEFNGPAGGALAYSLVYGPDAGGELETGIVTQLVGGPIPIVHGNTYVYTINGNTADIVIYALGLLVDCP